MPADLLTLADFSAQELLDLLDLADELKSKQRAGEPHRILEGKSVAMLFEKPSLRTRSTFEVGIFQLGGHPLFYETSLGERESIPDVARNLERWFDAIVARTHAHDSVVQLAENAQIPVINALTDDFHPCQILADAQTLREHKGNLEGLKVAFVGDGNNVFASWALLATRVPIKLTLVCPEGYEPNERIMDVVNKEGADCFTICHDPAEGVAGADAVYTDVWASMGMEEEEEERKSIFAPYQVNENLMAKAKDDALFLHCLPAHRGEEVSAGVMESARSVVFDEAENRLHAQKAVMVTLLSQ